MNELAAQVSPKILEFTFSFLLFFTLLRCPLGSSLQVPGVSQTPAGFLSTVGCAALGLWAQPASQKAPLRLDGWESV